MRKIFYLATIITLFSNALSAQDAQKEKIDRIKDKVMAYFNAKDADSLYALGGAVFKKQLSAEAFNEVCNNQLFSLGNFNSAEFEQIEKGVASYKASFDAATLSMYLSLDKKDKLPFCFNRIKRQ
jgi:hypothetical protein